MKSSEAKTGRRRTLLPRLLRTSAFRYTLAFFMLFCLSVGGVGYLVFTATFNASMSRIDEELVSELNFLAQRNAQFGSDGTAGLNAVVNDVARLKIVQKDALYMVLVGFEGRPFLRLTSDLAQLPSNALGADGLFYFDYDARIVNSETGEQEVERRPAVGRIANFLYSGAQGEKVRAVILTGRDISELTAIREVALETVLRFGVLTMILALTLGAFYSRTFLRRVDGIGKTVRAISDGDLGQRIALRGTQDEFDTLSDNINQMLNQIERLMTGMRQVSDNIAHDLRSPLTRIKARLDRVAEDPDADREQALGQTSADVERLLATFNALLSITRIESGEGGGSNVPVEVAAVAAELAELYEPAADEAGFELDVLIETVPVIMGSRELISQAIANLLDNALKYAIRDANDEIRPKIELSVSLRQDGDVLLSVMDNGAGVSEADYERILQRFVRLEKSRTTVGNGLGLSLVSAIARRHNATLTVGRGLAHHPHSRALARPSDYGLGIRLVFPVPPTASKPAPTVKRPSPRSE